MPLCLDTEGAQIRTGPLAEGKVVVRDNSIGLFPIHEYWLDVGRPDDLEVVEREHGDTGRNAQTSGRRKAK